MLVLAHVVHGCHGHGPHHAVQVRVGHGGGERGHLHLRSGCCTHSSAPATAAAAAASLAGDATGGGVLLVWVWVVLQTLLGGHMLELLLVQAIVVVAAAVPRRELLLLLRPLAGHQAALHLRVARGVQVLLISRAAVMYKKIML